MDKKTLRTNLCPKIHVEYYNQCMQEAAQVSLKELPVSISSQLCVVTSCRQVEIGCRENIYFIGTSHSTTRLRSLGGLEQQTCVLP